MMVTAALTAKRSHFFKEEFNINSDVFFCAFAPYTALPEKANALKQLSGNKTSGISDLGENINQTTSTTVTYFRSFLGGLNSLFNYSGGRSFLLKLQTKRKDTGLKAT